MASRPTPPRPGASPANSSTKPIVQRTITLRVDLRALAALGGALILIGSLLPWVTPLFAAFDRTLRGTQNVGGWPLAVIGVLMILLLFVPQFRTPRVSLPVAAFGFAAGLIAIASVLNIVGLRQALIGDQPLSPLAGIGPGIYITLAGSIIAILTGLAPEPIGTEAGRAEIRLWQPSFAILASAFVVFVVGGILFGFWIGSGGQTGVVGTPTPSSFDAGLLATPLINIQVNPLTAPTLASGSTASETPTPPPTETATPLIPIQPTIEPTSSIPPTEISASPTPTEFVPPTFTFTPTPEPTQPESPITTPTVGSSTNSTPTPTVETGTPKPKSTDIGGGEVTGTPNP